MSRISDGSTSAANQTSMRCRARPRSSSTVPWITIRPARRTATRSAARWTSLKTCDERKTVAPGMPGLGDHPQELVLHQRVEPARRFVEDQQVRARRESKQQRDLPPIARRQVARRPIEVDLQALRDRVHPRVVQAASEPADRRDELARGHPFRQSQLAWDVPDAAPDIHAITTRPPSEHLDGPAGRPDQIEQTPDGRALAGAVGTDEAEDLAGTDLEIDALHGLDRAEVLDETCTRIAAAAIRWIRDPRCRDRSDAHPDSATHAMAASRSARPNRLNLPGTIHPNAVERWATHPRSLTTAVRFHASAWAMRPASSFIAPGE